MWHSLLTQLVLGVHEVSSSRVGLYNAEISPNIGRLVLLVMGRTRGAPGRAAASVQRYCSCA